MQDSLNADRTASSSLMKLRKYGAITFPNTHSALQAEKLLRDEPSAPFVIMPVPKLISAGCGLAIKTTSEGWEDIVRVLKRAEVSVEGVFVIDKDSETEVQYMNY